MELTKITTKFAVTLYKCYLQRVESGIPRSSAIEFNSLSHSEFPDFSDDDIDFCINEMKSHKYKGRYLGKYNASINFYI